MPPLSTATYSPQRPEILVGPLQYANLHGIRHVAWRLAQLPSRRSLERSDGSWSPIISRLRTFIYGIAFLQGSSQDAPCPAWEG